MRKTTETIGRPWLRRVSDDNILLTVRVVTNAARTRVVGEENEELKVQLQARPVEGEANKNLTTFIAGLLGIAKSKVSIKTGETSRRKVVLCETSSPTDVVLQKLLSDVS